MNYTFETVEVRELRRGDLIRKPGEHRVLRLNSVRGGSIRAYLFTNGGQFRPRRSDRWERVVGGQLRPADAETIEDRARAERNVRRNRVQRDVYGNPLRRAVRPVGQRITIPRARSRFKNDTRARIRPIER